MTSRRLVATAAARPVPVMNAGGVRGIVLCGALITQWALVEGLLTPPAGLVTYSIVLAAYLAFEIRQQQRRTGPVFANPVVLTSIVSFLIPFSLSNFIFWLPSTMLEAVGTPVGITPWMNDLMFLVVIAACGLWVGYSSGLGRGLARKLRESRLVRHLISAPTGMSQTAVSVCIGLSLAARLVQLQLGIFGYGSDNDTLIALAAYREYFYFVEVLGQWALIAIALDHYGPSRTSLRLGQWLWPVLGYEMVWGFLSGFKARVVIPMLLIALAHYVQRGRFPRWLAPALACGLVVAYAVIEPYRDLWNTGWGKGGIRGATSTIVDGLPRGSATDSGVSTPLQVAARVNLTYFGSLGIEYAATSQLPAGSPDFLGNILWSPIYAVVPRLLWDAKPLNDSGNWYAREVRGVDSNTSTAMSGVTYLNFAGGITAVVLGFLFVGMTHRVLFDGLRGLGPGAWLVLIGLLPTLIQFESTFEAFPIGIMRQLPLLLAAQYFLFPTPARSGAAARIQPRPTPTAA